MTDDIADHAIPPLANFDALHYVVRWSAVQGNDISLSVSLMVGGTWVSGSLVSRPAYLKAFSEWMRDHGQGSPAVLAIAEKMEDGEAELRARLAERDPDEELPPPVAVHVLATYLGAPCPEPVPVEIRLDAVDVFFVGTLSM